MKCLICKKEKIVFFCDTISGIHIVACISCAINNGLKIIEQVKLEKEVKSDNKGMEEGNSSEG